MKSFIQFLLEQSYVTKDKMIESFIEFSENTPSILKIIYDEKLISDDQLLSVVLFQQENQTNFIASCKKLNLWSTELERKITNIQLKSKTFHHFLIENEALNAEDLNTALDDYISHFEENPTEKAIENEITTNSSNPSSEELDTTNRSLKDLANSIDPSFINQIKEVFSNPLKNKLLSSISNLKNADKDKIREVIADLEELSGATYFIKANLTKTIIDELIKTLDLHLPDDTHFTEDSLTRIDALLLNICKISEEIVNKQTETDYLNQNIDELNSLLLAS